jgi:hypothetical protein
MGPPIRLSGMVSTILQVEFGDPCKTSHILSIYNIKYPRLLAFGRGPAQCILEYRNILLGPTDALSADRLFSL